MRQRLSQPCRNDCEARTCPAVGEPLLSALAARTGPTDELAPSTWVPPKPGWEPAGTTGRAAVCCSHSATHLRFALAAWAGLKFSLCRPLGWAQDLVVGQQMSQQCTDTALGPVAEGSAHMQGWPPDNNAAV